MEHIVIIGNGMVSYACTSYSKKSDSKLLLYLLKLSFFLSRTALMYVFMGHMKFDTHNPMKIILKKKQD
jgi:hypothetical protein